MIKKAIDICEFEFILLKENLEMTDCMCGAQDSDDWSWIYYENFLPII